jgi:hypothetical protein
VLGANAARSARTGATIKGWVVVQGGTTWYLETKDLAGDALATARTYALTVEATPIADGGEPDSKEKQVALTMGQPVEAWFVAAANEPGPEEDWYAVTIPKDMKKKTTMKIAIDGVGSKIQVVARVYDGKGADIGGGTGASEGAALATDVKLRGPGTYLIQVKNLAGAGTPMAGMGDAADNATKPYTITVSMN